MEQLKIANRQSLIFILPDRAALTRDAARRFVACAQAAIAQHGRFAVALSGGTTPREVYALLATPEFSTQIDWARAHFFWGDERAVPPADAQSNYRMARETLLSKIPVPAPNVHRIPTELPPDAAALAYAQDLREFFDFGVPAFDLVLLGLGANGHTASLFPHTRVLHETQRWVAAEYIAEVQMNRITLTAPVINAAKNILWLVTGADKADTVRAVLRGAYRPDDLPAQLIQPTHDNAVWLLDADAGKKLNEENTGS